MVGTNLDAARFLHPELKMTGNLMMIGEKLREVRHGQSLSLTAVASKAKISIATLSRIENGKQGVDLGLFIVLAKILNKPPHEFLAGEDTATTDPLAVQIAALGAGDRATLWRELAEERRAQRASRRNKLRNLGEQVEELVAQIDFLREEIESVRSLAKKKR